jgi:chitinase
MYIKNKTILSFALMACLLVTPLYSVHAGLLLGSKDSRNTSKSKIEKNETEEAWLLTYYVGYQNGYLKPKDIDYSLMTHIVVGGVGVKGDGTLNEHWHMTNGEGRQMAIDVGERATKAGVKKLVWLGGPNEQDQFYDATSEKNRATLVKNIIKLLDDIDYEGVDIDWEPIRAKDEEGILALVKDLREADPNIIITVPVNWVQSNSTSVDDLLIFKDIARYADKMFIMSYSMSGPWPGWKSWHGGALEGEDANTPGSITASVDAYLNAGVPKEKLGIGIGTYATCWQYPVKRPNQKIPSTFSSKSMSVMSMVTMMKDYYKKKNEKWDSDAKVPYLSFRKTTGDFKCGFVSYENERSVEEKVKYAKRADLGGIMVWNIGTGYFMDKSPSKRNPLLKTAWETLRD